jgi:sugar phosphate isomerase/epimerase
MQWVMFSKHLAPYSIAEMGVVVRGLGFDGVDLTVRPGGHVLPEEVGQALPAAVDTLQSVGLTVPMITTGVTDAAEPHAGLIFETAAACGITRLKLGYWSYQGFGTMRSLIDDCQRKMDGIEALAKRHGVRACIHIHSGNSASANAAVVAELLRNRDPAATGAYIDPGHMTAEGSISGWRQGMDLLAPYLALVAVKAMDWEKTKDPATGDAIWRTRMVPLREGAVRWREVFALLKQLAYDGPVSFHSEYQGSHSWRDLTVPELIEQTREDFAYIRSLAG